MPAKFTDQAANRVASADKTFTAARSKIAGGLMVFRSRVRRRRLSGAVIVAGTLLAGTPVWAAPTTVSLTLSGTLIVDRAGTLTATLESSLPSTGFYDVYEGKYHFSETNFPTLPVTEPYSFTLTGTLSVNDVLYDFTSTSLGTATASETNALAMEAEDFVGSPFGDFFSALVPNTFYTYDATNDITVAAQTDLATVFPDTPPLSTFYTDGTYEIIAGLKLTATPEGATEVPEPTSIALIVGALFGLALIHRKNRES